jgi:hypothetical protein
VSSHGPWFRALGNARNAQNGLAGGRAAKKQIIITHPDLKTSRKISMIKVLSKLQVFAGRPREFGRFPGSACTGSDTDTDGLSIQILILFLIPTTFINYSCLMTPPSNR